MNNLSWADVARITQGRLGRTVRCACPFCSDTRRRSNQRKKVFAVCLKDDDFAIYNCVHCGASGYVHPDKQTNRVVDLAEVRRRKAESELREREDKLRRTESALSLWAERQPFFGSPAETYLRVSRGIGDWLDAFVRLDEALAFHPCCPFGNDRLPCMLALVRNIKTNEPQAIHRTALTLSPEPQRIDRLSFGPTGGGAIKLSPDDEVSTGILIAEGIETALSAAVKYKFHPVWSVLWRGGIADFPILSGIESVTVAVDNDASGDGPRAAAECVERLTSAGIEVVTLQPNRAKDFNDLLRAARC
jgi:hypothetical protein